MVLWNVGAGASQVRHIRAEYLDVAVHNNSAQNNAQYYNVFGEKESCLHQDGRKPVQTAKTI